jgi:hydroxypyruvate isomerase
MAKIGVCIEPFFSVLPYRQRIEKVHALGFTSYEFWFHNLRYDGTNLVPERKDFGEIAELNAQYGLTTTDFVFNHPDGGILGALIDKGQKQFIVDNFGEMAGYARQIGCKAFISGSGNKIRGLAPEAAVESMIDTLRALAPMCEQADITLLLEPFNTRVDHPDYFLDDYFLTVDVLKAVGSPKVKMLYDIYHAQIMSGNVVDFIRRHIQHIGHFHIAGVPGRHEPIDNELNYAYVVREIDRLGYTGYCGLEYWATLPDAESLALTKKHLGG